MKSKGILIVVFVLTVSLALHFFARIHVDAYRGDFTHRLHAAAIPLPTEAIKALAGEFKGMAANYLLLEAASFIGSSETSGASPDDWDAVARLLEQSSNLDPYFKHTYRLAQSILPWQNQIYLDETLTILERSKHHRPWDWEPGFFMGFDYYYFLKDNLTASRKMMEASKVANAPVFLPSLASRLASQAGQTRTAIDFLIALYEKTDHEQTRQQLKQRIEALQGAAVLESAIDRFQTQFGRMPQTLDELVHKSILSALPMNSYDKPYTLKNGKIDF